MSEFSIIQKFFTRPSRDTALSIGDDAALIEAPAGDQLAISTDMLVSGTHFFAEALPFDIGWKSMAVNISDMAAMGAEAKWATLSIALPDANEQWLQQFSAGLFACADAFGVSLIGGDTTRGPLTINVQIIGLVPCKQALKRSGAKLGDEIWHSGYLGSAAFALKSLQSEQLCADSYLNALHRPQPRIQLGLALRHIAHSAIDISDGLIADLSHILQASNLGATINWPSVSHQLDMEALQNAGLNSSEQIQQLVLSGGDDYELCFTAPASAHADILSLGQQLNLPLSCIGHTRVPTGITILDENLDTIQLQGTGYDHFKK